MGNQTTKDLQKGKRNKWKSSSSAGPPLPPGRPELATGNPNIASDAVTIRWGRPPQDGGAIVHGYIVEHRRIGAQQWIRAVNMLIPTDELTINGLEPGWRYQFRVIAQNAAGVSEPSESSEALSLYRQRSTACAPTFHTQLPELVATVEGGTAEMRVAFTGEPVPEIVWYKDGFELLHDGRHVRIDTDFGTSTLYMGGVSPLDEGEIKCTATNRAGHVHTATILTIENPPKINLPKGYEDGIIVEADETLRLKVGIEGRPAPTIQWTHNGQIIHNSPRFEIFNTDKSSSLKITNTQRADRGEYHIGALSKLGESSASFLVTVTSRPSPPGKVMITNAIGNQVIVSFAEPTDDGGCKIGNYIIEYNRVGWDVWLKATTSRTLSAILTDLITGSEYKFRAKAENPYGISEPGEESYLLFIPDAARGITQPLARGKSFLEVPSPNPIRRTPDIVVRKADKVDSETSMRPSSRPTSPRMSPQVSPRMQEKVKHTIKIQLPKQAYTESPSKATVSNTLLLKQPEEKLELPREKQWNSVHNSSEFMVVLYPEKEKVKTENRDTFDFDDDGAPPPPLSLSMPDLSHAEQPLPPPLRHAVSSTELLYERAMAKFYQAVANEEQHQADAAANTTTKEREHREAKRYVEINKAEEFDRRKSLPEAGGPLTRIRLNSLQDGNQILITDPAPRSLLRAMKTDLSRDSESGLESGTEPEVPKSESSHTKSVTISETVLVSEPEEAYNSDYTDSTASSEDSIVEKMKQLKKRLAQIDDGDDGNETRTYHPRSMDLRMISPYKSPDHGHAVNILSKPHPLPDPNFVPKPILKRPMSPTSPPSSVPASPLPSSPVASRTQLNAEPKRTMSPPPSHYIAQHPVSPVMMAPSPSPELVKTEKKRKGLKKFMDAIRPQSPKQKEVKAAKVEPAKMEPPIVEQPILEQPKEPPTITVTGLKLEVLPKPSPSPSPPPPQRKMSEASKKLLQNRQNSEEENKVVIDFYTDIVKEAKTGAIRKRNQVPLYMNPDALRALSSRDGDDEEDMEEEERGRSRDPASRNTFPRDSKTVSRDSSRSLMSPSRDESISRPSREPTNPPFRSPSLSRTATPSRDTSLSRPTPRAESTQRQGPPSRDPSLSRPAMQDTSRPTRDPSVSMKGPPSRDPSLSRPPETSRSPRDASLSRPMQRDSSVPSRPASSRPASRDPSLNRQQPPSRDQSLSRTGMRSRDASLSRPIRSREASRPPASSRDSSLSRPPNGHIRDQFSAKIVITGTEQKRLLAVNHVDRSRSTSPAPLPQPPSQFPRSRTASLSNRSKTPDELDMEEKVKTTFSYTTDLALLCFALYIYVFKDAILCIPILLLLLFRQLGDLLKDVNLPFFKRKKS